MPHAQKCPCGDSICDAWHVEPHAAVQGVRFTEKEARLVAAVLSGEAVVVLCEDRADAVSTAEYIAHHTPHINTPEVLT